MNSVEEQLRTALRRRTPPPGFAERVMARTQKSGFRKSPWRLAAIAAAILAAVSLGVFQLSGRRQDNAEGKMARDELLLGLQITADKLQLVREKLIETEGSKQ